MKKQFYLYTVAYISNTFREEKKKLLKYLPSCLSETCTTLLTGEPGLLSLTKTTAIITKLKNTIAASKQNK